MQDDITWGVKYLVSQGIADPKRVGIMGGSYGGYATLAGVTFTPDLYAAAVDYVGPSNLNTLLETNPALLGGGPATLLSAEWEIRPRRQARHSSIGNRH
jgi:dipeptidyl aminopeptidase/acylaminoacyl peptidase